MKSIMLCMVFCCILLNTIKSQDSLKPKKTETNLPVYKAGFRLMQGETFRADLMSIKDSSAYTFEQKSAGPDPFHKGNAKMHDESGWSRYPYMDIASIKIINKKTRTWVIVSGLTIGLIAGIIVGNNLAKGETGDESVNSAWGVILGGIVGAGVGSLTGLAVASAFEKKYMINGEWKNLEELKAILKN